MTNNNSQQQWHQQLQENSMEQQNNKKLHHVPVRRSQKLSDKITALQKLVSPYGKTDTASVLQEASTYIMLLQEQIQNLLRMLGSSYKNAAALHPQESGSGQALDLRSKGLCLVPVSITQKVTMEEGSDHLATSRKIVIANNF
ncbi:transcription factor bHLH154 isoform X2 [Pyrus x bretschneideri]|nr:transcription factor bHLH154 isoform X2 [Pyrus x bretschneideri]